MKAKDKAFLPGTKRSRQKKTIAKSNLLAPQVHEKLKTKYSKNTPQKKIKKTPYFS
jgi:hypothetical protein